MISLPGDVLVAGAVEPEVAGLRRAATREGEVLIGGRILTRGRLAGIPVRIMVSGPGPANTVLALTAAVEATRPGLILQIGCGGAFEGSGLGVGDVGVATEEIDAHLGIESADPRGPPDPLPFPVLVHGGGEIRNRYPMDRRWSETARRCLFPALAAEGAAVGSGPFVTVSTVTATEERADALFRAFGPFMENMEGAGAAHVALHYGLPLVEIRCASNRVGRRDRGAWDLATAFERCGRAARLFLNHLAGPAGHE